MPKFDISPGPWHLGDGMEDGTIFDAQGNAVASVHFGRVPQEEFIANMGAISTVPEMIEIL